MRPTPVPLRRLVVLVALTLVAAAPVAAQATAANFLFEQLDWYDENDNLKVANSSWGYCEYDVVPDKSQVHYLNMTFDVGLGPQWIVRNIPILPEALGNLPGREAFEFDISSLGIPLGTSLTSLDYVAQVSPFFRNVAPAGPPTNAGVGVQAHNPTGSGIGPALPANVGAPAQPQPPGPVAAATKHKGMPSVQEGAKRCFPGSMSRSIAWLDKTYKLGINKTAQQIYGELAAITGMEYEPNLNNKAAYLKNKTDRAITKVMNASGTGINTGLLNGIKVEPQQDVIEYLKKELTTEDVELHYGGHIVTLTGISQHIDGMTGQSKWWGTFRDDRPQGSGDTNNDGTPDDQQGDSAEKQAEFRKNPDGTYSFRENGSQMWATVHVVVSESTPPIITPNPGTTPQNGGFKTTKPTPGSRVASDWVKGSLNALRAAGGQFSLAGAACVANDTKAVEVDHSGDMPAAGEGFWYLERHVTPGGNGSYDSAGLSQADGRDDGLAASGGDCPSCEHDKCLVGPALAPGCNACVDQICAIDPTCCGVEWSLSCVEKVLEFCQSADCPESRGLCPHTVCAIGEPLFFDCDVPPWPFSCVTQVCTTNPDCCAAEWSEACVEMASLVCGINCE